MEIKKLISRLVKRVSPEEASMKWCEENGFKHGKNFLYYGYPIDSNWPWLIEIGDNVTLATGVQLLAHDAGTAMACGYTKIGRVKIGSNVFVGAHSIVLCNVEIGDNCIIGAGSVVTRNIPNNSVFAGNPAKYVCSFEEFKKKHSDNVVGGVIFTKPWWEWRTASAEEREDMKRKLDNTFGYTK